jgi:hypothetical protein
VLRPIGPQCNAEIIAQANKKVFLFMFKERRRFDTINDSLMSPSGLEETVDSESSHVLE